MACAPIRLFPCEDTIIQPLVCHYEATVHDPCWRILGRSLHSAAVKALKLNVWIPGKDTGVDLLVTDPKNRCAVSLQVKYGKDFLPGKSAELRKKSVASVGLR
jgi:hypothetical protein